MTTKICKAVRADIEVIADETLQPERKAIFEFKRRSPLLKTD